MSRCQYNFNTTGGTSGSPVFDQHGWVIAVNFSSIEARVTDPAGDLVRIGVGSLKFRYACRRYLGLHRMLHHSCCHAYPGWRTSWRPAFRPTASLGPDHEEGDLPGSRRHPKGAANGGQLSEMWAGRGNG